MKKIKILIFCVFFLFCFFHYSFVRSEENYEDKIKELQEKIEEYEQKIKDLQKEKNTLANTIAYLDNKIKLTLVQITATEEELKILGREISDLSFKIDILDKSINQVSVILASRIEETYKRNFLNPVFLLFSSSGFSDFFSRIKYLKTAQIHDRQLLFEMQRSKMTYDSQKRLKEEKQAKEKKLQQQLKEQQLTLSRQKQEKAILLEKTKNDEQRYQQLLAAAKAEIEAIQSIIAGKGKESKVGEVKEGEKIASVISGASACSTGTHLHFEITKNNTHLNPANFLKNISLIWDNSPDGQFGFSGDWSWPLDEPIRITQGYGMTYWARLGWYGGNVHSGIDIVSESSLAVKAVKDGTLYRGSISCGGGTLRYVKIIHKDSDYITYYVHVNYY